MRFAARPLARKRTPALLNRLAPSGVYWPRASPFHGQQRTQIVEKWSFETQAQRRKGEEKKGSFLRKGVVGDWRNYFTLEAAQTFDRLGGDTLIKLGYEKDRVWVTNDPQNN